MTMIPYGQQWIEQQDIDAVIEVLKSDWLTQGPAIERFERAVAAYCGARYAVAVSSGTAALHIACLAADLGKADSLWTSPNTFVASANCGPYCGARPDFVDIDPGTYNMDAKALAAKLASAEGSKTLPRIVIPVHFAGQSCDMEAIASLAKQYRFTVIEDAAHALGGSYKGHRIGSCQYSDMTILSFHPVKIITTGEGGMVLTNREDLYERLLRLRSHGITRDSRFLTERSEGPWYYEQLELGMHYRITDLQAALGLSQLGRLDQFVARRRALAKRYDAALAGLPLTLPWQHPDSLSAYHLYVLRLKAGSVRKKVFESLRERGIGVNVHYIPVHTQPYYRSLGFRRGMFPQAERYYDEAITIPLYPKMSDEQQDRVISALREVLA